MTDLLSRGLFREAVIKDELVS